MTSPNPPMIYDYSGFPEHTYHITYPAPGSPQTAERVCRLIEDAGFVARLDPLRGFDHGTFSPLAVTYPNADVPVLQLSMRHGYNPEEHLAIGLALAPLRNEGLLIVGSGLSYHNLREFGTAAREPSAAFNQWLQQTLVASSPAERIARLINWEAAKLGGFLARKGDGDHGPQVLWRGFQHLPDITHMFLIMRRNE